MNLRRSTFGLAVACILLAGSAALVHFAAPGSSLAAGTMAAESPCSAPVTSTLITDQGSTASEVDECPPVSVGVTAVGTCPAAAVDFVFLLPYGSNDPGWVSQTARQMIDSLRRESGHGLSIRAGVVYYYGPREWRGGPVGGCPQSRGAGTSIGLVDDLERARGSVRSGSVCAGDHFDYVAGAQEAIRVLAEGEKDRPQAIQVVVFFGSTGYCFDEDCRDTCNSYANMLTAGRKITSRRIILLSVCSHIGQAGCGGSTFCDAMREAAGRTDRYSEMETKRAVEMALRELRRSNRDVLTGEMTLEQRLPTGVEYIPDSASVAPSKIARTSAGETLLRWRTAPITTTSSISVQYSVQQSNSEDSLLHATTLMTDTTGATRLSVAEPITLTGSAACLGPVQSSSAEPPATETTEPDPPTGGETEAPAVRLVPVYLPLLLSEPCGLKHPTDVALVIDTSTSMQEITTDGRTKMEGAREAAGNFIDLLRLETGDRAGIVAFNTQGAIVQPMTSDRAALSRALDSLETHPGTCLFCGVQAGGDLLDSAVDGAGRRQAMVVLTDGRSHPVPADKAVSFASAIKEAGVTIYTIGLGPDVDGPALSALATVPRAFRYASTAATLRDVYRDIAYQLPCPTLVPAIP